MGPNSEPILDQIWGEDYGPNSAQAFQPRRALAKLICFLYFLPVKAKEYHQKTKKNLTNGLFFKTIPQTTDQKNMLGKLALKLD
jgi:hypothetical protein